jgi:hypothetical protein
MFGWNDDAIVFQFFKDGICCMIDPTGVFVTNTSFAIFFVSVQLTDMFP